MRVNGVEVEIRQGLSLAEYMQDAGYEKGRAAVEKNGELVPAAQWDSVLLSPEDELEIVSFVGGG